MDYKVHFAPLQGYTDDVYREAHSRIFGGVENYYTPFVRLEKEGFRNKDLRDIAPEHNQDVPVIPQLIAATPDEFRRIAAFFRERGYRQADINMGCPFPMQARLHRGAGILPYKEEAVALLGTIREFPEMSFSLKLRLGWEQPDESLALLPFINSLPLAHVTLHPRIGLQQYKGVVDIEGFSRFYEACTLPLFYNGDLGSLEDIHSITDRFPALKGVMLGRGLLSHPWLAAEYANGKTLSATEKQTRLADFHRLLAEQYSLCLEGGDHQILAKLKTLWDYLLPDAEKRLRKKVIKSNNLTVYYSAVKELLS
ncbi:MULTISPECIES: tRNA-dihydrouridine synthase family protein [Parabacteroides]|uniref:tRNA-dihydrouridine synthase family protein n=1 Tax=Parabacteroides leei TaxID=2939491 RepID=UPI00189C3B95|nr:MULTISPECIES: tRNA-dihydrouridine synthase family protein [Parabacteroides]MCL3850097.1 tRNA-dihydrouridine synthase family protein [Parabacteroides leei]